MPGVVVVGSANVDLVTNAPRMPSPGETLHGTRFEQLFGGKGANQAVAAALLGSSVTMVAKLGDDSLGEASLANFKTLGVDTSFVTTTSDAASGVAQITVDETGQNEIVIVGGANSLLNGADVQAAAPAFARSGVLLTQLEVPLATNIAALRAGRKAGLVTVFNSAPAPSEPLPDELYQLCDVICPNETETALLTGMPTESLAQCEAAAKAIIAKGAKQVVLTLGGRGCMLVSGGKTPTVHVPVPDDMKGIKVLDTTGAGDGFLGALAHLVASGLSLADALPGAVRVASISVQRRGAQSSYPVGKELPDAWHAVIRTKGKQTTTSSAAAAAPPLTKASSIGGATAGDIPPAQRLKRAAAYHAVDTYVRSGMLVGIGTGDTADYAIERLAERLKSGTLERVSAVPTSGKTEAKLKEKAIPSVSLETHAPIDVAIGSADAVDAGGNIIKGGKGALLREKLVRAQATQYVVAVDEPKLCGAQIGASYPIPVEIAPFYAQRTVRSIMALPALSPCDAQLRFGDAPAGMPGVGSAKPFVTDNGNYIVDVFRTAPLADVAAAARELKATVGVVEHGLFEQTSNSTLLVSAPSGVRTVAPQRKLLPAVQPAHLLLGAWLGVGVAALGVVALTRK